MVHVVDAGLERDFRFGRRRALIVRAGAGRERQGEQEWERRRSAPPSILKPSVFHRFSLASRKHRGEQALVFATTVRQLSMRGGVRKNRLAKIAAAGPRDRIRQSPIGAHFTPGNWPRLAAEIAQQNPPTKRGGGREGHGWGPHRGAGAPAERAGATRPCRKRRSPDGRESARPRPGKRPRHSFVPALC